MKFVISSDWHLDAKTAGVRRLDDLQKAVSATVQAAIEMKADAYIFTGDMCDPDSGPIVFECAWTALYAARKLHFNLIPSFWLAGNHDVIEDGSGATTLTPLHALAEGLGHVLDCPELFAFDSQLDILALPFTASSHPYDPEEWAKQAVAQSDTKPLLVLGHLHVPGVVPGEETLEMPRGREVVFPREVFRNAKRPCVLVNGHYHRQQEHDGVHIPGSLARLTFGEEEHKPGFLVLEI